MKKMLSMLFSTRCQNKYLHVQNMFHDFVKCCNDLKFFALFVCLNYVILKHIVMEGLAEFIVILGIFYWLFSSRVYAMVDMITNRLHEAYTNWALRPTDDGINEGRLTLTSLRRFGTQQRRNLILDKEVTKKVQESCIYNVKESQPKIPEIMKPRPLVGLSCQDCMPNNRKVLENQPNKNLNIKNILFIDPAQHKNIFSRTFNHLAYCFNLQRYFYPQVSDLVLRDERFKDMLHLATTKDCQELEKDGDESFYEKILKKNEERAKKILFDMRSTLSDFLMKLTAWVLYKLLPCFMSSVAAHPQQVEMLRKAADSGVPLIFLPLHRSHLDYILISFILVTNNIRAPLVAAGDNLRIPFFGSLLRGLGAFYIKRRIDPVLGRKDIVYRGVLHTYMMEALQAGHNIEFFIEGGRTRTGKPCMPKGGVLSVVVDAYMDGTVEDALLVPVSINYERLVDGNFNREQLGQPKQMETFSSAMKAIWSVLNSNYGMMRIDFNQPFSIKELVKTFREPSPSPNKELTNGINEEKPRHLVSQPSTASLYGTDVVVEKHRKLVDSIACHVIYDCVQSTSIMSTNAVAFLLLNKFRNGVSINELVSALDKLRTELDWANKDVGFTGDSLDVVNHALDVLGPALIVREKADNMIRPVCILPNVHELNYYSNSLIAHFVLDAVISTSLFTFNPKQGSLINQDDLIERCLELCDILKYEFIFCKPCRNLESILIDQIDNFKTKEILCVEETLYTENEQWSRKYAKNFDDSESSDEETFRPIVNMQLNLNKEQFSYLHYLRGMLRPLIEAYTAGTKHMEKMVDRSLTEKDLVNEIMDEIRKEIDDNTIAYCESLSVDTVKNCLKLLVHLHVLESHSEDKTRIYYLSEHYDDVESLSPVIAKLNCYKTSLEETINS